MQKIKFPSVCLYSPHKVQFLRCFALDCLHCTDAERTRLFEEYIKKLAKNGLATSTLQELYQVF